METRNMVLVMVVMYMFTGTTIATIVPIPGRVTYEP